MKKTLKLSGKKIVVSSYQPSELEVKLKDALAGMLGIKHRIAGCSQPACNVCKDNNAVIAQAEDAIKEYEKMVASSHQTPT